MEQMDATMEGSKLPHKYYLPLRGGRRDMSLSYI
jgi:hypothetical protein